MNNFDLLLLALVALGAWGGWRLGLIRGILAWAGLGIGVAIGVAFVDDITNIFKNASPSVRFLAAGAFVALLAVIAQSLGMALGSALARVLPARGPIRTIDQLGGAALGGFIALVMLWLLIPALASSPGWTARGVRGSWIAREVQAAAPDPPSSVETLGRLVARAPFPEVFRDLTNPGAGDPPAAGLEGEVASRVAQGVVRIEGQACGLVVAGTGFAVSPTAVVTNAHVVAGERATSVYSQDGRRRDAVVVAFDPNRDLAVLRVDGGLTPLERGDAVVDGLGAVVGHPGGGPLRAAPARIERMVDAQGTDIYRTSRTTRDVLVLAARLAPGDSGAPLVDTAGNVVGVAFAIDPGDATTAYALARSELDAVVDPALSRSNPVDTGRCLVG